MDATGHKQDVWAVVVAAGRGRRCPGALPKQYLALAGRPVLAHTLSVFDRCSAISRLVLVVAENELARCREMVLDPLDLATPLALVPGGDDRQASVQCGLAAVEAPDEALVAVHDGVRPLVTVAQIEGCLAVARRQGAAVLAVPAHETLKQVDAAGAVVRTLERERVWLAQTPQVFRWDLLQEAHRRARQDRFSGTDDAALVERLGHPVLLVPGDLRNIKITTPADVDLVRTLMTAAVR